MPEVIFNGPEGRIQGMYYQSTDSNAPIALVLHPHPLHGGTMNNKVAYNIYQSFVRSGFSTLRINFRGVGKSQGKFDNGIGELTDAATALDWLQMKDENKNTSSFWIAGFSFGSWIALQLMMRRPEIEGFIAVSPPVNKYDFSFLSPCPASGLVVQGDRDSIVSEESVANFVERINRQVNHDIEYSLISGADHFYREKLDELSRNIDDYLTLSLNDERPKKSKFDKRRKQAFEEPLL